MHDQSRNHRRTDGWVVRDPVGRDCCGSSSTPTTTTSSISGATTRTAWRSTATSTPNFNGKADQYRWFHTAGSRWGLDRRRRRRDRLVEVDFGRGGLAGDRCGHRHARSPSDSQRLLLTPDELKSLGPGQVARPRASPRRSARRRRSFQDDGGPAKGALRPTATWVQFSAPGRASFRPEPTSRPRTCGSMRTWWRSSKAAESTGKLQIGTLVQVGDAWRLIDTAAADDRRPGGSHSERVLLPGFDAAAQRAGERRDRARRCRRLLAELEKLDDEAREGDDARGTGRNTSAAAPICWSRLPPRRRTRRSSHVAPAACRHDQRGRAVGHVPRRRRAAEVALREAAEEQRRQESGGLRQVPPTDGGLRSTMQAPKADFAKIQTEWLKTLEQYVGDYPTAPDAAEAMLQIGDQPGVQPARKTRRRSGTGGSSRNSPIRRRRRRRPGADAARFGRQGDRFLAGRARWASPVDLANYRGKVVLIQYWATWCGPCKADMATLKELWNKYGRQSCDRRRQPGQQREGL